MPLINKTVFTGFADRIAKHYSLLKDTVTSMTSGTGYFERMSDTDDADVEIPLVEVSNEMDDFLLEEDAATDLSRYITPLTSLITGFENHMKRMSSGRTWDSYCDSQDVRVSDYTNQVHFAKHRNYMNARNVFNEEEASFCSCVINPSGITFTDGDNFGTGASANKADGTNFAGAQLKARVTSSDIVSPVSVQIIGLDYEGSALTMDSLNNIVGPSGTEIIITPASGRFVDVTGVSLVSGGTVLDSFEIVTIKEREIAL